MKRENLAEVLRTLEDTLTRTVRRVLIVEDDLVQRDAVSRLWAYGDVETVGVPTPEPLSECRHSGTSRRISRFEGSHSF
ncbi:hypothetical protein RSD66_04395 [Brevundimonas sp. S1H14]|uniref:hypothetical protein n=1 Tax=Brevundimonas sp. S1H14 TaxID=3078084 RepID=UPI0039E94F6B